MTMGKPPAPTPRDADQQWRQDLDEVMAIQWPRELTNDMSDSDWLTLITEATEPTLATMSLQLDELDEPLITGDNDREEDDCDEDDQEPNQADLTYTCALSAAAVCFLWLKEYLGPELRHSATPPFTSMSLHPEIDIAHYTTLRSLPIPQPPEPTSPEFGLWLQLRMARTLPAKDDTDEAWTEAAKSSLQGLNATMHRLNVGKLILKQDHIEPLDPQVAAHMKVQGRENIYSSVVYLASTMQAWAAREGELHDAHLLRKDT